MELSGSKLAHLFGLTIEALRFYEKNGIVSPTRKQNGYRSFGLEDMYNIIDCKRYQGLGFSLQEICHLLSSTSETEFLHSLHKTIEDKKTAYLLKDGIIKHWEQNLATLDLMPLRGDDLYVKRLPEQICINFSDTNLMGLKYQGIEVFSHLNLGTLLPLIDIKRIFPCDENASVLKCEAAGLFFEKQYFDLLDMPKDVEFTVIPAHYCFCKSVKAKTIEEIDAHIQSSLPQITAKGFQIGELIFANSLMRVKIDDTFVRYTEIEIPVCH